MVRQSWTVRSVRGVESQALFENIWRRMPELARRQLNQWLGSNDDADVSRVAALLRAAPSTQFSELGELFGRAGFANLERKRLGAVRRFLHDHIRTRKSGYVEAYARLSELERQLSQAR